MTVAMPHARSVAVSFYVGAGNRYEDEETSGLSHYLEHILFKGTKRYPTPKMVSETVESVGGVLNATTDREATVYYAKVPKAHAGRTIDLLVDMLREPLMEPGEFEKERGVILEELAATEDSPPDQAGQLLDAILFPDQPLGWDVGGTPGHVRKLTREQAIDYMRRQYVPNNIVMSVAGDIDHATIVEQARALTAGWEPAEPGPWFAAKRGHRGPVARVKTKRTEQAHLSLAVPGYSLVHPDRQALDILSTILGEGMSSRLFMELRERRSLCYDIHSYTSHFLDTGAFSVYAGVDPHRAPEAITAILEQLAATRAGIPEEELRKAKELTKGRLLLRMEDTRSVSGWLGVQELLTGRVRTVDEVVECVEAVTVADLKRVAVDLFRTERLAMGIVGPFRSDKRFVPLLSL